MKRNLKKSLLYFDGNTLTENKNGKDTPILICDVLAKAMFEVSTSVGLSPDEKYQAFKISRRIVANPEAVDLESADVVLIRKIITPSFSAGIYGQIVDLLEDNQ